MTRALNGYIMSKDIVTAIVIENNCKIIDEKHAPYYFHYHNNVEDWLRHRAIDNTRAHSRLLKKLLRISNNNDIEAVLRVHAVSITDTYWFKFNNDELTWNDVNFKDNIM